MSYLVQWDDHELNMLAAVWNEAPDKAAVTEALAEIERLLARDPIGYSEALPEGLFVIEVDPLRVLFEFSEAAKHVKVVSVARRRTQSDS